MGASGAEVDAGEKVDVLIVTAVEIEYQQALLVETGAWPESVWERHPGPSGFEIAFRTFRTNDGSPIRFGLTRAHGMGGVEAVNVALPAIAAYRPRCLAMCGVCAGRRGDIELGDVIVADRLWAYDTGKLKAEIDDAGKRTERVQGDMWQYLLDPVWKVAAERFTPEDAESWLATRPRSYEAQGDWVLERVVDSEDPAKHPDRTAQCADYKKVIKQLWKAGLLDDGALTLTEAGRKHIGRLRILDPDGLPDAPAFKTEVGPIGSGGRVVQDPQIFDRLSSEMRKVLGLEMEASAIGAIGHLQKIKAIVMKGVMDFADPAKADNFKQFAARASAECLIAFLRENLEPEERGFDDILETGISPQPKDPSPSQLLNARYRFVPFYEPGRATILEELRVWCCETEASASSRLVYAAGGIGKTRLMSEVCERLRGAGWNAGFLTKYAPEQRFRELAKSRRPTLVVIDYAQSRAILAPLMRIAAQEGPGKSETRLRIILLARGTGDWWEELRKDTQVRDLFGDEAVTQLIPLAAASSGRDEVFRSAALSYAKLRGADVPNVDPPLDDARFDRALYVHMAALGAVEGRSVNADSLMDEMLDHEEKFWIVQVHPSLVVDMDQKLFRIAARRTMAAFTLIGGEPTKAKAEDLLNRMEGQVDKRMLSVLHNLYLGPTQSTGRPGYVGALEPDLLGEAMVVRALCGEDDGANALLNHVFLDRTEDAIEHGFAVLGRVSVKHQTEASAWIVRVLARDLDGRALAALAAAKAISRDSAHALLGMVLATLLEQQGTEDIAERLEAAGIPNGTVSLREVAIWVTSTKLRHLPAADDEDGLIQRGILWNNLGAMQRDLGRRELALDSSQEAVSIYRTLVAKRPNAFLPDLARGLNNLGNKRIDLGQLEPALAATLEAVAIYRALAAASPNAFLPYLASSLNNLGTIQHDLGQRESALASAQEAVAICRKLAAVHSDASLADLATSLNNLGTAQIDLNQGESALASTQEAVAIRRMLAAIRPDTFLPDLASSLNNMGNHQSELGQRVAALASIQEAVAIYRRLAAARPEAFLPYLASSLNNLGIGQSELGQNEPASISAQEALDAIWPMFLALPAAFYSQTNVILRNINAHMQNFGQVLNPKLLSRIEDFKVLGPK
jgi:nucleoside phosphorylase/tetratricopeptide (TPR) repeat protein